MEHEVSISIKSQLDKEGFQEKAKAVPIEAAQALDPELREFDNWMAKRGMDPLTRVEMQIIREFLAYKMTT